MASGKSSQASNSIANPREAVFVQHIQANKVDRKDKSMSGCEDVLNIQVNTDINGDYSQLK